MRRLLATVLLCLLCGCSSLRESAHGALVLAVGAALSLDEGQIDALFVAAAAK